MSEEEKGKGKDKLVPVSVWPVTTLLVAGLTQT